MNTQKGFSNLLGFLLIIIVLGGGIYFYIQNSSKAVSKQETVNKNILITEDQNNKKAPSKDSSEFVLDGTWKFEEVSKVTNADGVTYPGWVYTLSISKEDNTKGVLSIDGYQALVRLNVSIEKLNDSANVKFDSYAKDNIGEIYKKGDVLFAISPAPGDRLGINWYKMEPGFKETKTGAYFERQ